MGTYDEAICKNQCNILAKELFVDDGLHIV